MRGSLMVRGVRVMRLKERAWRATPVVGPSMRACEQSERVISLGWAKLRQVAIESQHTLLWSITSTMTASLPASGP